MPSNVCKNIFSNLHKKEKSKAGDTPGDFIGRSPRSAKIARCARCSNCDFRRSPRSAYKIADMWHVKYWRLDSPSVPVPAIFYAHRCESPAKSTTQVGRLYHMTFQNTPRWSPGTSLKCHIVVIGEKNRQVCPHQSVAKIACDFRWQSNSPRSAFKIARCVVGFTAIPFISYSGIRSIERYLKPATHLATLYADRRDGRKSSGAPGAAIAIFADRRDRLI